MRDGPKPRLNGAPLDLRRLPASGGDRVVGFVEQFCRLTKGKPAGQLVKLRPWQREIVHGLFDEPRARFGYISMPRKNSKSYLAACIALYALLGDAEEGAEVYVVAGDERQARIVWNYARRMVELDERLSGVVTVYRDGLEHVASDSVFAPLPADPDLRQGLNPSFVVIDEVHVVKEELWAALSLAQGARERPLLVGITTPGHSKDSLAWRLDEHGRAGDDPSFYYRRWSAPEGCDVTDEDAWAVANPALNDFLSVADMRATARSTPEHSFRRYRLGQWTATASAWLPFGSWDACNDPDRAVPPKAEVILAFDGSYSGDSTALVGVTLTKPHHLFVVDAWEKSEDPGWRVPRGEVDAALAAAMERYKVKELAVDPFGWRTEIQTWEDTYGARVVVEYPTNSPGRMGPACDRFFQAVMERQVSHDGDARLARHLENATTKRTTYGEVIVKDAKSSPRKIDLAVAAVVALDRAQQTPDKRRRVASW